MCDEVGAVAVGVPGRTLLGRWLGVRIESSDVRTIVVDTPAALLGLPPFAG